MRSSWKTPERMRTVSGSLRCVTNLDWPGRRRSRSCWISASISGRPGGQPSTTQPIAGPWLSPKVVTRNRWPKLLKDIQNLCIPKGPIFAPISARFRKEIQPRCHWLRAAALLYTESVAVVFGVVCETRLAFLGAQRLYGRYACRCARGGAGEGRAGDERPQARRA